MRFCIYAHVMAAAKCFQATYSRRLSGSSGPVEKSDLRIVMPPNVGGITISVLARSSITQLSVFVEHEDDQDPIIKTSG